MTHNLTRAANLLGLLVSSAALGAALFVITELVNMGGAQ